MSIFDDKEYCLYLQTRNISKNSSDKLPDQLLYFLKSYQDTVGAERLNELKREAKEINRQRETKTPEQAQQLRTFQNGKYEKISALIIQYVDLKSANASSPEEIMRRLDFVGEFSRINRLSDPEICRNLGLKINSSTPTFHFPNELSTLSQHQFAASKDSQQPEVDLPVQKNAQNRTPGKQNYSQQSASEVPYPNADHSVSNGNFVYYAQGNRENTSAFAQNDSAQDALKPGKSVNFANQSSFSNQQELIQHLQAENSKLKNELFELRRKQGKSVDEVDMSRQNIEQATKIAALQSENDQTAAKNAKLERDLAKERADNKKSKEQIQQLNRKCENVELFALEIQKFIEKSRRTDRNTLLQSQPLGARSVSAQNDTFQASQIPGKRDSLRRSALFSSTANGAVIQLSHKPEARTETFTRQLDLNDVFREFQACFEYKNMKISYFTQTKGELRAMRSILDDTKKQFQQLSRAFIRGLEDRFNDILINASLLFKKRRVNASGIVKGSTIQKSKGTNFYETENIIDYNKLSQVRIFNNREQILQTIKEDFPLVPPVFVRDKTFEVKQLGGKAKMILEKENISLFLVDFTTEQGHTVNLLKIINPLTFPRVKILFSCCAEYGGKLYDGLRLKQTVADKASMIQIQVQNPQEYVQFCNIVDQKMLSLEQITNDWVYEIQMHFYNEELTARIKSFIVQICNTSESYCHQILDRLVGQEGAKFIIV